MMVLHVMYQKNHGDVVVQYIVNNYNKNIIMLNNIHEYGTGMCCEHEDFQL